MYILFLLLVLVQQRSGLAASVGKKGSGNESLSQMENVTITAGQFPGACLKLPSLKICARCENKPLGNLRKLVIVPHAMSVYEHT